MEYRYAVEARIYDDGHIDAFIRDAEPDEVACSRNLEKYDLYVEIFDDENEALEFLQGYAMA